MPYLGFFQRLLVADLYVVLDNVQYLSGSKSWHNRDRIKTREGAAWLTVPTQKAPQKTAIGQILIAEDGGWRRRHLNLLEHNYRKAPFIAESWPALEELYSGGETRLADFTLASIRMLMRAFDLGTTLVAASELQAQGASNELLADILEKTGATAYLSGVGARDYFDPAPFQRVGVTVNWQDFRHPEYPQLHGAFAPFLSSIDLLLNCGKDTARSILRSC